MLDIDFTFNLLTATFIIVAAGIVGYAFRSRQILKSQMKIVKLRREIANNHAHILELQKECVGLENQLRNSKVNASPFISVVKDFQDFMEKERKVNLSLPRKQQI